MRRFCLAVVLVAGIAMLASMGMSQRAPTAGSYKLLKRAKVGGVGGFDYIFADVESRRLYIPRRDPEGQLMVFNLDTLESDDNIRPMLQELKQGPGIVSARPRAH